MARRHKRYRVSGFDEHGDLHAFETDHRDRAHEMAKVMAADGLKDVEVDRLRRI